jgi:acetyltransferase-like isoleucine patch superfamily enzyme
MITQPYKDDLGNEIIIATPTPPPPSEKTDIFMRTSPYIKGIQHNKDFSIEFANGAKNCKLIIGNNLYFENTHIKFLKDNGTITFHSNGFIKGNYTVGLNSEIEVGERLWITSDFSCHATERAKIKIGNDCIFGDRIKISTSDLHPIFDVNTLERINKAKDIIIDDYVWITSQISIMKGSYIRSGSVIAKGAVVSGSFPNNVIIGGIPAKVIKKDICWERSQVDLIPIEIEDASYIKDRKYFRKTEELNT